MSLQLLFIEKAWGRQKNNLKNEIRWSQREICIIKSWKKLLFKGCFKSVGYAHVIDIVVMVMAVCAWPWNDVWSFLLHPSLKLVVCCVVLKHLFFQLLLFHPSVLEPDLHLPGPRKTKSRRVFLPVVGELWWGLYYYPWCKLKQLIWTSSPYALSSDRMTFLLSMLRLFC